MSFQKAINELKKSKTVQDIFLEYKIDLSEIDYIPICFEHLDVSARTDHGIIYLNTGFRDDNGNFDEDILHYLTHEITHYLQQTSGDGPTKGSTDDTYLDNEFEQEGFQMQTKYISETHGDEKAETYIDQVMDHHEVPSKERKERKKELLELAASLVGFKAIAKALRR